jgi:hypothetical protein
MHDAHVEQVMDVITDIFDFTGKGAENAVKTLRERLCELSLVDTRKSRVRFDWVNEAREVAEKLITENGSTTIEDVLAECPLPEDLDRRVIGGVLRDRRFHKVGTTVIPNGNAPRVIGVFQLAE